MKNVLVLYWSHDGHTARVARTICETIRAEGHGAEMMNVIEADREGVDLNAYDIVVMGAAIRYGHFSKSFIKFADKNADVLNAKPNSFFNLTLIARKPEKATLEGNVYARKFVENSRWKPQEVKCIAGKVDYPNWSYFDAVQIQLIMSMTKGPTDRSVVCDYTDWEDVKAYAHHILTLDEKNNNAS